jgi:hypothetical protein
MKIKNKTENRNSNENRKTEENRPRDRKPVRTCRKPDRNVLEGSQNRKKIKKRELLSGWPKRDGSARKLEI